MYYVMDAHSFYNFIYFILLIIVSPLLFLINIFLNVLLYVQYSLFQGKES